MAMAMATATLPISSQCSLCTPRLVHMPLLKSQPKNLSFRLVHSKPICHTGHSLKFFSSAKDTTVQICRQLFKTCITVGDRTLTSEDEAQVEDLEESESDTKQKSVLTIKSLLQLYKEAILNKDDSDTTASEIEAALSHIENEKNKLLGQVTALSEEANSGKERYIRLQADFENFRKRSEKERLTVRSNAQGEVIESLLPMVDNFERAKQQLKLETKQEKKIDASYQGIYKQFVEIMRSLHVAVVPTVGKPFDPSVHVAIAREESKEFNEGIVMEEFRRGFLLGEQLLRPAMVKVSVGLGQPKSDSSATQPST